MATSFFFRAVASDGKLRTGTITAETEKSVAQELKRQGLIPVYVGFEKKQGFELKMPTFARRYRKDVLFFTQELSTLLNAGVPLDRALGITAELTEKGHFRSIVLDVMRILKGGKSFADSLATHPLYFSELYVNMVRAGEASGSLGTIFERLSEFERTRDDLRGYIVSSLIYPGLLTLVGLRVDFHFAEFRGAEVRGDFLRSADDDPDAHADADEDQRICAGRIRLPAFGGAGGADRGVYRVYPNIGGRIVVGFAAV